MAGSGIHWESLHDGQRLDGWISNVSIQQVSEGQVSGIQVIGWHQAALQACPLVSDISDIEKNLSWQLPLNVQSPVLKIRGMCIVTIKNANAAVEAGGWIDEGWRREIRSRPAVLQDKGWSNASIGRTAEN